jgi:hypothetical protein
MHPHLVESRILPGVWKKNYFPPVGREGGNGRRVRADEGRSVLRERFKANMEKADRGVS